MQAGFVVRDYVLEEKIGEGGMGEVWRSRHQMLNKPVAIKVMAEQLLADPLFEARFIHEAQAQARLQHPQIIGATDFFREQGRYYLVMPMIEGYSLEERLARGPLPVEEALRISADVLAALDYAHQQAVIHRDVKPSNILIDRDGRAYLTDFGIALMMGQERKTRTGIAIGTPHYMSPEQIRRPRGVDHRTDVYSFGCVLYEMLTRRTPFEAGDSEGDTDYVIKEAHVHRTPEPLRRWNPSIPEAIDAIVTRALAKNPDDRFVSCGEFVRAIRLYLGGEPVTLPKRDATYPPPLVQTVPKPSEQKTPALSRPKFESVDQEFLIERPERKKFLLVYAALTVITVVVFSPILNPLRSWFYYNYGFATQAGLMFGILIYTLWGLIEGLAQWSILRKYIEPSKWWILARVLANLVYVVPYHSIYPFLTSNGERLGAVIPISAFRGVVIWLFLRKHTKTGWLSFLAGPVVSTAVPLLSYIVFIILEIPFSWFLDVILDAISATTTGLLQALCFTHSKNIALRKR